MKRAAVVIFIFVAAVAVAPVLSQSFTPESFAGLRARSIGPAVTSGRVMTIAVDPTNTAVVLRRRRVGRRVEDGQRRRVVAAGLRLAKARSRSGGSRSTSSVRMSCGSARASATRSGRSRYGDGVYKSEDGGRSWTNVGLKNSEHIGRDRHQPEGQRHGVRRRAGAAVGAGRRPRALQDHRRRQDLDAGAEDLRAHRRQRRRCSIRAIPT